MAQFQYVDTTGKMQSVEAPNSQVALSTAPNLAKDSGVMQTPVISADTLNTSQNNVQLPSPVVNNSANGVASSLVPQTTTQTSNKEDLFKQYMDSSEAPASTSDLYSTAQKEAGIVEKQQAVNDYTAQLNQINAELGANKLKQGDRLASMGEISGTQGKLERDAAIRALPISASLNAAQGNLQAAQSNMETLFKLKSEDATNLYNYKKEQRNAARDFMTEEQKRISDAQQKIDDRAYETEKSNLALSQEKELLKYKQSLETGGTANRDTSWQDINGSRVLVDNQTGEIISGGSSSINVSPEQTQKSLDQFAFLRDTLKSALDLSVAASPSPVGEFFTKAFTTATRPVQLQKKLDTLKVNLLTLNTDPAIKKFFGPQMTERDTELMTSAGTTMDAYTNTPKDLKDELQRYDDLINRMQTAVKLGQQGKSYSNTITAPDGTIVQITD